MDASSETSNKRKRRALIAAVVGLAVALSSLLYGVWQQLVHGTVDTEPPPPAPNWPVVLLVAAVGLVVLIAAIRASRRD